MLDEYHDHLPLTARQIFYRLVGAHGYDKTERAYDRFTEHLGMARRAGIIAPEAIRDDGVTIDRPLGFHDLAGFSALVADYRLDRLDGQPVTAEVWSEAAGMVPQLARVAAPYGVAVCSGSGFDSLTAKIDAAKRAAASERPLVVLNVGDHDPSGVHLFSSAYEEVEAWAVHLGGKVSFERVAVTPEQIAEHELALLPRRRRTTELFTARRARRRRSTRRRSPIVIAAIERQLNLAILHEGLDAEESERAEAIARYGA